MTPSIPDRLREIEQLLGDFPSGDQNQSAVLDEVENKIRDARTLYENYLRRVAQTHSMCRELSGRYTTDDNSDGQNCSECASPLTSTPPRFVVLRWVERFAPDVLAKVRAEEVPSPTCGLHGCEEPATGICYHCRQRMCARHYASFTFKEGGKVIACPIHAIALREQMGSDARETTPLAQQTPV